MGAAGLCRMVASGEQTVTFARRRAFLRLRGLVTSSHSLVHFRKGVPVKALLVTFAVTASIATAVVAQESPAAPDTTAPAATTAPASKRDPNARVCKTTPVIGSRVPSRVCMTRAQWEERARIDRQDMEDAQRRGLATCGTNPCGG